MRLARTTAGFSLDQLAKLSHVGLRTIHAIEVGDSKKPHANTLRAIAEHLHPYTTYERLALAAYNAGGVPAASPAS